MREAICTWVGIIGSAIAQLFGGWDASILTLIGFMGLDYVSGLIVAGVFHASKKTESGALESRAGWKGLCRKGGTLVIVIVACCLDSVIGSDFVRDAVVLAFLVNETISIIENIGLMGIPIPRVLRNAVEILKARSEEESGSMGESEEEADQEDDQRDELDEAEMEQVDFDEVLYQKNIQEHEFPDEEEI